MGALEHPQIVKHFKLDWAKNLKYRHFKEGEFTYRKHLMRYMSFKYTPQYYDGKYQLNIENF